LLAGVFAGLGAAWAADRWLGEDTAVVGLVFVALAWWRDREVYRHRLRPALVRVAVEVGVTRAAVSEWLGTFATRAVRLASFRMFMPRDKELRLLSFIAAATHPDERLGADLDDDDDVPDDDDDEDGSLIRPEDPEAPRGPLRRFFDWFNDLPFVR
jgi:hypothetical protein